MCSIDFSVAQPMLPSSLGKRRSSASVARGESLSSVFSGGVEWFLTPPPTKRLRHDNADDAIQPTSFIADNTSFARPTLAQHNDAQSTLDLRVVSPLFQFLPLSQGDHSAAAVLRSWRNSVLHVVSKTNQRKGGGVLRFRYRSSGSERIQRHTVLAVEGQQSFQWMLTDALAAAGVTREALCQLSSAYVCQFSDAVEAGFTTSTTLPVKPWSSDEAEYAAFKRRCLSIQLSWAALAEGIRAMNRQSVTYTVPHANAAVVTAHSGRPCSVETVRTIVATTALAAGTPIVVDVMSIIASIDFEAWYALLYPASAAVLNLVPSPHSAATDCTSPWASLRRAHQPRAAEQHLLNENAAQDDTELSLEDSKDSSVPFFVRVLFGSASIPPRPRRVAAASSDAIRSHWRWSSTKGSYYYGLGEGCKVFGGAQFEGEDRGGGAGSFSGLYFPDSLLLVRPCDELPGEVETVALCPIPYGTCFTYGGQLVHYTSSSGQGVKSPHAKPPDDHAGEVISDRVYEFGVSNTSSIRGAGVSRCLNHRYNFSLFGNVQFTTVPVPQLLGGRTARGDGGATKEHTSRGAARNGIGVVPIFICTTDIEPGERVVAASYGEGYDARLERRACCGGLPLSADEAYALQWSENGRSTDSSLCEWTSALARAMASSPHPASRISPWYTADYRYAVTSGAIVVIRRWLDDPHETARWEVLERTVPTLRLSMIESLAGPAAPPCAHYVCLVRDSIFPHMGGHTSDSAFHGIFVAAVHDWFALVEPLAMHKSSVTSQEDALYTMSPPDAKVVVSRCVALGTRGVILVDDTEYSIKEGVVRIHGAWLHALRRAAEVIHEVASGHSPDDGIRAPWSIASASSVTCRSGAIWPSIVGWPLTMKPRKS